MTRLMRIASGTLAVMLGLVALAEADGPATSPGQTGPLHIQVTAVQGGAQYRLNPQANWQPVTVGLTPDEGVEFRTGPRGSVQFTVGDDDTYRVDRLSVIKVLRANLQPDGTIRTDVGMTYGRVSKDVDAPSRPHADTIVTPVSTLAVRGTHVAMYDQPPFEPQVVSLTGLAIYKNKSGHNIPVGSAGGGPPAQVSGDDLGSANTALSNSFVDPQGGFAGRTGPEITTLINQPTHVPPVSGTSNSQPSGNVASGFVGGQTTMTSTSGGGGPGFNGVAFGLSWTGAAGSIVDLQVSGGGVSLTSQDPPVRQAGGTTFYGGSRVANSSGDGSEVFVIINSGARTVAGISYDITESFGGEQSGTVATTLIGESIQESGTSRNVALTAPEKDTLESGESLQFQITAPFQSGALLNPNNSGITSDGLQGKPKATHKPGVSLPQPSSQMQGNGNTSPVVTYSVSRTSIPAGHNR